MDLICRHRTSTAMNPQFDILHRVVRNGMSKGIGNASVQAARAGGTRISMKGQDFLNFGSCSYLGLEHHPDLIEGAIQAVREYGTQYSSSRTYSRIALYDELEAMLSQIFGGFAIATPTKTLGHQAALPALVGPKDVILLDHHVHASVQNAARLAQASGTTVRLIPHNDLDALDRLIAAYGSSGERVWYCVDGIYSMFGNGAPLQELSDRLNQHGHFRLYVDDAHGMSWSGERGQGYALSQMALHKNMVLATSLNKAFASAGGALVMARSDWHERVLRTGGPLLFSGPIQPPMLGAALASAKLHLSGGLAPLQARLRRNIEATQEGLLKRDLPLVCDSPSPIFYVGCGLPEYTYDVIKGLREDGCYAPPGVFPAVPMKRGGVRFTVTAGHSQADIDRFLDAMAHHHPRVMAKNGVGRADLDRLFGMYSKQKTKVNPRVDTPAKLKVEVASTVDVLNANEWDWLLGRQDVDSVAGLRLQESLFAKPSVHFPSDWVFKYIVVRDATNCPVLATYLTVCLTKSDMLSSAQVSERMEVLRGEDAAVGQQKMVMIGSLLSEGGLFLDRNHPAHLAALKQLVKAAESIRTEHGAEGVILRGITGDAEVESTLLNEGHVRIDLPETHAISDVQWNTSEAFLQGLKSKYRYCVRKEVLPFEGHFEVRVGKASSEVDIDHMYALYLEVKARAREINTFDLPKSLFAALVRHPDWDVLSLHLKEGGPKDKAVAVMFSHRNGPRYAAKFVGLDYRYLDSHKVYKQVLYRTVMRAAELGCTEIQLGLTATLEKKKLGASVLPQVGYVRMESHFMMDALQWAS